MSSCSPSAAARASHRAITAAPKQSRAVRPDRHRDFAGAGPHRQAARARSARGLRRGASLRRGAAEALERSRMVIRSPPGSRAARRSARSGQGGDHRATRRSREKSGARAKTTVTTTRSSSPTTTPSSVRRSRHRVRREQAHGARHRKTVPGGRSVSQWAGCSRFVRCSASSRWR